MTILFPVVRLYLFRVFVTRASSTVEGKVPFQTRPPLFLRQTDQFNTLYSRHERPPAPVPPSSPSSTSAPEPSSSRILSHTSASPNQHPQQATPHTEATPLSPPKAHNHHVPNAPATPTDPTSSRAQPKASAARPRHRTQDNQALTPSGPPAVNASSDDRRDACRCCRGRRRAFARDTRARMPFALGAG